MSARIIALPTAAIEPVVQRPRRGRYPAIVTLIQRGHLIKLEAESKAEKNRRAERDQGIAEGYRLASLHLSAATPAEKELAEAQDFYATCKRILETAERELRIAQQRVGKNGGAK